ncbi:DMT family transporter [Phaeovulum sp.]|uniref:DMT family transporter n=1 Tax=Phaeovulum sp. TaxID=2934796 RepID=UPI003567830F
MNLFLFAVTVLIWGSTWLAIAFELGPVPVLVSVFYRFALAALLLWPLLLLSGKMAKTRPRDHLFMGLQGLCLFSLNFLCFYNATAFIPSGLVSVIFSLATIYNAINARLFFNERITARALLATAVGVAGLVLIFWHDLFGGALNLDAIKGIGLAALGTLFFSLGNMVSRKLSGTGVPPLTANAWGMGYGALFLVALIGLSGAPLVTPPSASYVGALLYLALFGSVIGFTTYLMLVARIGSGRAAYATVMFPVIALMLSWAFEGYHWQWQAVLGVGLTLLGNAIMFARAPLRVPRPAGLAGRAAH